jgi:pSer/pThr/pTyr-binding forkhead associated (FHA) protein
VLCSTCGKANADHLVFCEDCGARLQPRIAPPTPPIGVPMPPSQVPAEGTKCARCGAANAPGMRFCITCGSPLEKPSIPVPVPAPVPVLSPSAPSVVASTSPIAPVAVVGLAPQQVTETLTCKRCQGKSEGNAQFCRFCGAPLAPRDNRTMPSAAVPAAAAIAATVPAPIQSAPRLDQTLITSGPSEPPPRNTTTPPEGRLVVVHKDGGEGQSFPLLDQMDIGRESGECLFSDDRYMAPRHARIVKRDGALVLRDLGTSNGVYKRIRKDDAVGIEDNDLILLGQQVLRFEVVKDAEAGFGAASEQGTLVFGTPAGARYARLSQRTTEGVSCDVFHVRKPETTLGRESCDIVFPDDPFISRRHAALRSEGSNGARAFKLADLGSSNGTFVRIHGEVALAHGDEIRLGQQLLRVDLRT